MEDWPFELQFIGTVVGGVVAYYLLRGYARIVRRFRRWRFQRRMRP